MQITESLLPAAVIAALVTCVVNLFVARGSQRAQRQQWLMGRKQDAYIRFLNARREMINLATYEKNLVKLVNGRQKLLGDLRPTEINLLASEQISSAATVIYDKTKSLINPRNPTVWTTATGVAIDEIHDLTEAFRDKIKNDLHDSLYGPVERRLRKWSAGKG